MWATMLTISTSHFGKTNLNKYCKKWDYSRGNEYGTNLATGTSLPERRPYPW
jgi:hypothetical protein